MHYSDKLFLKKFHLASKIFYIYCMNFILQSLKTTGLLQILLCITFASFAQITVNTNFEGGNGIATYIDNFNNTVHIMAEYKGGDIYRADFYTEISGLNTSLPLLLQIDADFAGPFVYYSFDNQNWQRQQMAAGQFSITLLGSTIYISPGIPHRYSHIMNVIDSIDMANNGYTQVSNLTYSEEGRPVPLLSITAPTCESYEDKSLIWLIGGHHAAEDPARHVTEGMLRFFVSNHPMAERLRKESIIYVAPIMDVDQIYNGGTGKDQLPVDFNRDWISLTHNSHWNAVQAVKDSVAQQVVNHPLLLFVDSHNIAPYENNNFNAVVDLPHQRLHHRFIAESMFLYSGQMIGEVVITLPNFNTAVSQDYMIDNYDQPEMCSITPETTFTYMPDGSAWTLSKYRNFGIDQAKAYSDYIHGIAKANDILIDNTDPSNTSTGTWTSTANDDVSYLNDLQYASAGSNATFTFNATIPTGGLYEIFIFYSSYPIHATNAPVTISTSTINNTYSVDMTTRGGKWISLDQFTFAAGENVQVSISALGANGFVIADGVRLSRVPQAANVSFSGLPSSTFTTSSITLSGNPPGGYFTGNGVVFNAFNPGIAGPGFHSVSYHYTNAAGCETVVSQSILVGTITYNFVNYGLGTIAP